MSIKDRCAQALKGVALESSKDGICQTPGAMYHISILSKKRQVTVTVDLPDIANFPDSEKDAIQLEDDIHDAMELALAKMFPKT